MPEDSEPFFYFAYGSNMYSQRLLKRTPSARPVGTGFVTRRQLVFDKLSKYDSGKANIKPTEDENDRVYGVLFEIKREDEEKLDSFEPGYEKSFVKIKINGIERPAQTYIATEKKDEILPYHWYKALIVQGALENCLPEPYIKSIRRTQSKPDIKFKHCLRPENGLLCLKLQICRDRC